MLRTLPNKWLLLLVSIFLPTQLSNDISHLFTPAQFASTVHPHTLRPLEVASTILGPTLPLKAPPSHVSRLPPAIPPQAKNIIRDIESQDYDEPYYSPPPIRIWANNKQWQESTKFELPELKGIYGTYAVLDWLQDTEHILKSFGVPNDGRVIVVVSRFRDIAATCWLSLCTHAKN